jgi:hypothetical protein
MEEKTKTITKPAAPVIHADEEIFEDAKALSEVEKQVIVHCYIKPSPMVTAIRIWNSTYLRDKDSSFKSKLLSAFNITVYPTWMAVNPNKGTKFTLVFSALPKSCKGFDLFEDIPQGGGFYTSLISRNKSDVYSVNILS